MSLPARLSAAVLSLAASLSPSALFAQQTPPPPPQKTPAAAQKKKPAKDVDPLAEVRRQSAISLALATGEEANRFTDRVLRARVLARAADVLWDGDKIRAERMFRNAWRAAVSADEATARMTEEERRRQAASRGTTQTREPPNTRREVLRLAARRSAALGEEFLAEMEGERKSGLKSEATSAAAPEPSALAAPAQTQYARINPDAPPPAMMQRLGLARQILEDGDTDRAMQFADPALYPVNTYGMNILDMLRERNAAAADERFGRLLLIAANDPQADANTVSLLAAYALTPYLYITVRPDGQSHTRNWRNGPPAPRELSPALRDAFLRTAAQILLRPLPPPDQDTSSAGRTGTYTLIARLAPVYEQFMPDVAASLRARQSVLMQDVPENNRRPDDPLLSRGLVPEPQPGDAVQNALDRLPQAKTADERDRIYYRAAMNEDDPDRARELVNKIEDFDLKRQLLAFLAFRAVESARRDKRAEDVVRLARADELNSVQRTWALTEAARLFAKDQPGRALEVLDLAINEARKIDQASPDRARALIAIVTHLHQLDRPRAWEIMNEVVKASNSLPDFSGEDGGLTIRVEFKGGGAMTSTFDVESFDLAGIFDTLAREDFNRAADLSKAFTGEAPRAAAALAVARSALDKK